MNRIGTPYLAHPDKFVSLSHDWVTGDKGNFGSPMYILQPKAALESAVDSVAHFHNATLAMVTSEAVAVGQCLNASELTDINGEVVEFSLYSQFGYNVTDGITASPFAAAVETVAASNGDNVLSSSALIRMPVSQYTKSSQVGELWSNGQIALTDDLIESQKGFLFVGIQLSCYANCNLTWAYNQINLRRYATDTTYPRYGDRK